MDRLGEAEHCRSHTPVKLGCICEAQGSPRAHGGGQSGVMIRGVDDVELKLA